MTAIRPPFLLLALVVACAVGDARRHLPEVAPPLDDVPSAYEAAAQPPLPEVAPQDRPDLHNVYHLSEGILSGGEPLSAEALARLADWGVKTILSVDGKVPDAQEAARLGMRYVHVPIRYKGLSEGELLRIVKTFRELPAPFYVHCFHGRHRGPAAAAIGRLVIDGVDRSQALAEMRQWCGTSQKYEGLYQTIASAQIPTLEATAALDWDFPAAHRAKGMRGAMVGIARAYDRLAALKGRGWRPDPDHPDVDARNEAAKLRDLFETCVELSGAAGSPEDFRGWMVDSLEGSEALEAALKGLVWGQEGEGERAVGAWERIGGACSACHRSYRD